MTPGIYEGKPDSKDFDSDGQTVPVLFAGSFSGKRTPSKESLAGSPAASVEVGEKQRILKNPKNKTKLSRKERKGWRGVTRLFAFQGKETTSKEEVLSMLMKRTEQVKKLESKISGKRL